MHKRTRRWPLIVALAGLVALVGAYVCWPLVAQWSGLSSPRPAVLPLADLLRTRLLEAFVRIWFFFFGAVIGSFLNVVVHRSPRGESILGRSHCPRCRGGIRWYDNVPVLSWFVLAGRCRDCRLPISPRYPCVEFALGMIFLILANAELFSGGANLPLGTAAGETGIAALFVDTDWKLVGVFSFHALLMTVLVCWGLIQLDGKRVPTRFIMYAALVGFAAPAIWPGLHPINWRGEAVPWHTGGWEPQLTSIYGLATGTLLGLGMGSSEQFLRSWRGDRFTTSMGTAVGLAAVGLYLGWQAAISVAVLSGSFAVIAALLAFAWRPLAAVPYLLHIAAAALIQIAVWKWVVAWAAAPNFFTLAMILALAGLLFISLAALLRPLPPGNLPPGNQPPGNQPRGNLPSRTAMRTTE